MLLAEGKHLTSSAAPSSGMKYSTLVGFCRHSLWIGSGSDRKMLHLPFVKIVLYFSCVSETIKFDPEVQLVAQV